MFNRLDELNVEALVIPHGTTWGIHAPANATMSSQLTRNQHDPKRQRLFEVYSGHGNSEVYKDVKHFLKSSEGKNICPEPTKGFEPCCWRAGEIAKQQCHLKGEDSCEEKGKEIKQEFKKNNFAILKEKKIKLEKHEAEKFYKVHQTKPFYNDLCSYLSSGPIVVMVLESENAVLKNRELMGATDPTKAEEGTLRKKFGLSIDKNSVHGSDSLENAKIEIDFFFKD